MAGDDFKVCPFCKEHIRKHAVKCRFCGEWLEEACRTEPALNQGQGESPQTTPPAPSREPNNQSLGSAVTTTRSGSAGVKPPVLKAKGAAISKSSSGLNQLIPFTLVGICVFGYALPLAIKNGASGAVGIFLGTLSYCTTPESMVALSALTVWLWATRRKKVTATAPIEDSQSLRDKIPFIVACFFAFLICFLIAYSNIQSALESARSQGQQQTEKQ